MLAGFTVAPTFVGGLASECHPGLQHTLQSLSELLIEAQNLGFVQIILPVPPMDANGKILYTCAEFKGDKKHIWLHKSQKLCLNVQ